MVTIVSYIAIHGPDTDTRVDLPNLVYFGPIWFVTGMYVSVIISVLYQVFLEEYEHTFTLLKGKY